MKLKILLNILKHINMTCGIFFFFFQWTFAFFTTNIAFKEGELNESIVKINYYGSFLLLLGTSISARYSLLTVSLKRVKIFSCLLQT